LKGHRFLKDILMKVLNAEKSCKMNNISGDKGKKNAHQET
jgi:hypothetical protein